jgi:hypothetical protein
MIEVESIHFYLDVLLVLSDALVISFYRDFLTDLLIGSHNRKSAKKYNIISRSLI